MNRIVRRLHSDESGVGLVEVLLAMLVFAIVAVSVAYSVTLTLTNTRDSKARQMALNLAASDIDAVRAIGDPFEVHSSSTPVTSNGETFTVQRTTSWVSEGGGDADCSASGGTLRYKRVNVTVTWTGMGPTGIPARTDTILAPASRINDPSKGTVFVSVKGADGLGEEDVSFTVSPNPGAGVVVEPTDVEGCSFLLGVTPGTYTVTLGKAGYIDFAQATNPTRTGVVTAGGSTAFAFQYDRQSSFPVRYASNALRLPSQTPPVPAQKIEYPAELSTTYVNANGVWNVASPVTEAGNANAPALGTGTAARSLHPYPAGYQAFAGPYADTTCEVHDPEAWAPDTTATPPAIGLRAPAQGAAPGGTAPNLDVPMGVVDIRQAASSSNRYVVAVRQSSPAAPGQPACSGTLEYRFGEILPNNKTGAARMALPFGTWRIYAATSSYGGRVVLPAASVTLLTKGVVPDANGSLILDPRGVQP
ncbi:hypothetical protein [Agromyces sp. LHK192]|uniref:hypothetical protein n=1 Tax=Agromyces sp. LHK192 TaxID=2498704 RepID=UPI0013E382C0|nr:hypothetical protein [Agromyces sp. LHK192]